ncbi:protein kinase domain-containing protein [Nocardia sp. NPDC003345]
MTADRMLRPGSEFAGYRIERHLGAGGMGTVYLARHPRLPRSVALKVLDTTGVDPVLRTRFEREADLAVRIDHPNVVEIYDRGDEAGRLWIAMRYVPGTDAARLIRQGRAALPPRRVQAIVAQAAEGLDAAHRRGLLHRDIKPANLLVSTDDEGRDQVLVTDFGIARAIRDDARLTDTGAVVATLAYVSPEQIRGEPADHRADIYALGCTLYQMLTGRPPFERANPAAVLTAHLEDPPPRPSEIGASIPAAMDAVIARALAKAPADRYGTCRDLAAAAGRALTTTPAVTPARRPVVPGVAVSAPSPDPRPQAPAAPPSPGAHWYRARSRRISTAALLGATAGLAVVAVLVVAPVLRSTAGSEPGPASTTTPAASASSSAPTTSAPVTPAANPAWGRNGELVALFPGLLPPAPGETGYQGVRCTDIDVLNNGGAPAVECVQDNGLSYYVWSFRRGDPRRDATFTTAVDNDTTREEAWTRASGSGRMRWSDYAGANTGLLTVSFDDPARAWVVVDVSWPHHTGADIVDRWWSGAPV